MIKFKTLGIRGSLWLTGIFTGAVVCVLAAENLLTLHQGAQTLNRVYERSVVPSSQLLDIDKKLETVRFDMAAVMFDKVPFPDASARLQAARQGLPESWRKFKEAKRGEFNEEESRLVAMVDRQLSALEPFYKLLGIAYASSDKVMARSVLDDDWPQVEENLLKPVLQLIRIQEGNVRATYAAEVKGGEDRRNLVIVTLIVGVLVGSLATFINGRVARSMSLGIRTLKEALARVADGDFDVRVDYRHTNELGETARYLEDTLDKLRRVIAEINANAKTVAVEAERLATSAAMVETNSRAQSDAAEDTAAVVEEMLTSIEQVADNARESLRISQDGHVLCRAGRDIAQQASREMGEIAASVTTSAELIGTLNRHAEQISNIVSFIKEIAGNTNLLALNAAIEAARAGEHGRGFAVVADEVRKLAERTAQATSEIEGMIGGIQDGTGRAVVAMREGSGRAEQGVACVQQTSDALDGIYQGTEHSTRSIGGIADATEEQAAASRGIARNVERIVASADENRVAIEQLSASILILKNLALTQRQSMARFKV